MENNYLFLKTGHGFLFKQYFQTMYFNYFYLFFKYCFKNNYTNMKRGKVGFDLIIQKYMNKGISKFLNQYCLHLF